MNTKINTSIETEEKIIELQGSLRMPTKASIIRIGMGLYLAKNKIILDNINTNIRKNNVGGSSYTIMTIFGEKFSVYKSMIETYFKLNFSDDELFLILEFLVNEGVLFLYAKFRYYGNNEKMFKYLLEVN